MRNAPVSEPLVIELETALGLHAIDASVFAPFAIQRLKAGGNADNAELLVILGSDKAQEERFLRVRIRWNPDSAFRLLVAVQGRVVTEWAALGVACALIPEILGMRVLSVALDGERYDYRIGNEEGECGLEVSGTLTEDIGELQERHRLKARQLGENPFGAGGYVIVVGFARREALITSHAPV
ncbi:hypothetical protein LBMAG21_16780 [Armatimonadota bacterium]|nr:hypothetical protein LBMAG21_16780 [Armatimonadota bacterium]